jgi:hypothetical protein
VSDDRGGSDGAGTGHPEEATDEPTGPEEPDADRDAGSDESTGPEADGPEEPEEPEEPEPTPQSPALRRQQSAVALGGSLLAGGAVTVGLVQGFPGGSVLVAGALGALAAVALFWLFARSVFAGE